MNNILNLFTLISINLLIILVKFQRVENGDFNWLVPGNFAQYRLGPSLLFCEK